MSYNSHAMILIVGLGNPGIRYGKNRHNVGFMLLDKLCEHLHFSEFKNISKFSSFVSEGELENQKMVYLVKPQTFMNRSGEAVSKLVSFYKIPFSNLWLVYDDIDLPLGEVRFREKGSPGTHNGMRSIVAALGTDNFPRFRIGIETRGVSIAKNQDITSFVLGPFSAVEKTLLDHALNECVSIIEKRLQDMS